MQKIAFVLAAVAMAGGLTTLTTTPAFAGTENVTIDTSAYDLRSCQTEAVDAAL